MEYYNAVLKRYNRGNQENLRFIYYQNLQSRNDGPPIEKVKIIDAQPPDELAIEFLPEQNKNCERDYKYEAIARAKRVVKELMRNSWNDNFKLLTLTYAKKVESRAEVLEDVKSMCRRYKKMYDKPLKYIASLEWQHTRHCLHIHLIIDSHFIDANNWSSILWQKGFIKINSLSKGHTESACLNAVNYVLKYIQKDAESCPYYTHLYFRSKHWNEEITKEYFIDPKAQMVKRFSNAEFGNGNYIVSSFNFVSWNEEDITIVDVYKKRPNGK